jgi:hypothetical protein
MMIKATYFVKSRLQSVQLKHANLPHPHLNYEPKKFFITSGTDLTPVPAVIEERKRTSKAEEEMTVLQIWQAVETEATNCTEIGMTRQNNAIGKNWVDEKRKMGHRINILLMVN